MVPCHWLSEKVQNTVLVQGLKRTIACMDEEHPRTEASINNRSHLRQILNMEGLYRKNRVRLAAGPWQLCKWITKIMSAVMSLQVQNSPLQTLLEIIVKHHIKDKINSSERDPLQSAPTISSDANSPVVRPTVMNDTKTEDKTAAFIISKHIKLRYFTSDGIFYIILCCFEFLVIAFERIWDICISFTGLILRKSALLSL